MFQTATWPFLLLTDAPGGTEAFLPSGATWEAVPVSSLSSGDQTLWGTLVGTADPWVARGGQPGWPFWSRLFIVEEASSSQLDGLRDLADRGFTPEGPIASIALNGEGFHGQHGRPWATDRGNLHLCTFLASPGGITQSAGCWLPALTALAVTRAIDEVTVGSLDARIKWVNDILLAGAKAAGVLTTTWSSRGEIERVITGIGLNIVETPIVASTPFVPRVTSLRECLNDGCPSVPVVLQALLDALAWGFEVLQAGKPRPIIEGYLDRSCVIGRDVRLYRPETGGESGPVEPVLLTRGRVEGIGQDLSLKLFGRCESIVTGRLAFEEDCRRFGW